MYGKEHMTLVPDALKAMRRAGLSVEEESFGFSVRVYDSSRRMLTWDCGCEHDGSVRLAMNGGDTFEFYYRSDFLEMAEFLVSAFQKHSVKELSASCLAKALNVEDADFDYVALEEKLAAERKRAGIEW